MVIARINRKRESPWGGGGGIRDSSLGAVMMGGTRCNERVESKGAPPEGLPGIGRSEGVMASAFP